MTCPSVKRFVALCLAFVLAFTGLISTACNSGSDNGVVSPSPLTSQPSGRYFAFQTDNSKVPAMAIDAEEGVLLGVVTGNGPDSGGAVFVHNGQPITVFRNASGLPGRMVVGTTVFLFENYTDTTVDIASASGNQFEIARR